MLVAVLALSISAQEYDLAKVDQVISGEYSTDIDIQSSTDELYIKAYPNPVVNTLNITGNIEILEICVFTVSGELLHRSYPNSNEYTIDFSRYKNGMYFLRATTSEMGVFTETIVKQ